MRQVKPPKHGRFAYITNPVIDGAVLLSIRKNLGYTSGKKFAIALGVPGWQMVDKEKGKEPVNGLYLIYAELLLACHDLGHSWQDIRIEIDECSTPTVLVRRLSLMCATWTEVERLPCMRD